MASKVYFKFYYPEFSNIFLSIYAMSGLDMGFGQNYRLFLESQKRILSNEDIKHLDLFQKTLRSLTSDLKDINKFMDILFDHRIENLIMLERKIKKEFGKFDCKSLNKVYLYFYERLQKDYKFFSFPITNSIMRLDNQLKDFKIIDHLEKFEKFLRKERILKKDRYIFLSCNYFGNGHKAYFQTITPDRIIFSAPILANEKGEISFEFNEKLFLGQIFSQSLYMQYFDYKDKFAPLLEKIGFSEDDFRSSLIGALYYGVYNFDVYKELLKLEKVTDFLERKKTQSKTDDKQISLSICLSSIMNDFYEERKGLDDESLEKIESEITKFIKDDLSSKNLDVFEKENLNNPSEKSSSEDKKTIFKAK